MLEIRVATVEDWPAVLGLIHGLARFEKLKGPDGAEEDCLFEDIFDHAHPVEVLVAELNGEVAGYAAFYLAYSTFRGAPVLWLEDLFVKEDARRSGVARELMEELATTALDRGCCRIGFHVLGWNTEAMEFYHRCGAKPESAWVPYSLEGDALNALAREDIEGDAFPDQYGSPQP